MCDCVHGECNSGPDGDGQCYCQPPYSGPRCDQGMAYALRNQFENTILTVKLGGSILHHRDQQGLEIRTRWMELNTGH